MSMLHRVNSTVVRAFWRLMVLAILAFYGNVMAEAGTIPTGDIGSLGLLFGLLGVLVFLFAYVEYDAESLLEDNAVALVAAACVLFMNAGYDAGQHTQAFRKFTILVAGGILGISFLVPRVAAYFEDRYAPGSAEEEAV